MKVSNEDVDVQYGYVKILDFKSKEEREIIYKKVQQLIKEWQSKRKVFA